MADATTFATGAPPRCGPAWPWPSTSTTSVQAQRLAGELGPWFGVAKVGLELYSAAGPKPSRSWWATASRSSPT